MLSFLKESWSFEFQKQQIEFSFKYEAAKAWQFAMQ